ncbi:MAG TPA: LysR substrate-binding domain-containing protein [Burkholderiaceae bacterium]
MDLRQLRQFVVLAETLNFRRAAEKLHMTQPPLTAAIKQLEEDLGVRLFERNRRAVDLTPAGHVFLHEALGTLAQAARAKDLAQKAASGRFGSLRLSYFPGATFEMLPRLLKAFIRKYPDVSLSLTSTPSSRQGRHVLDGSVDMALVMPSASIQDQLHYAQYMSEHLVLAVPAHHWLAEAKKVDLKLLTKQKFVGLVPNSDLAFGALVVGMCQKAGFIPAYEMSVGDILTALALVATGVGIALVPSSLQCIHQDAIRYVVVTHGGAPLSYDIALAYLPHNPNPVVSAMLGVLDTLTAASSKLLMPAQ